MKLFKTIPVIVSLLLTTSVAFGSAKVDTTAPGFTLTNSHGEEVNLSDYSGKYVILEWTNHDCPYVKKHYKSGNMQSLQAKYTDKDVVWMSIISSAPGKQGFVDSKKANALTKERNAAPSHVLFDPEGKVGRAYGARTTPHMYIINPEGELKYAGAIDSIKSAKVADIEKATNYIEASMNALMKGNDVPNKITSPYGCSIKYKG